MSQDRHLSDHDIEQLLMGNDVDPSLDGVATWTAAIRRASDTSISSSAVAAHVTTAAAAAAAAARLPTHPAPGTPEAPLMLRRIYNSFAVRVAWRPKVMPRVAIAGVALVVFVTMSSGLANAADGAKPGDWMYGLDRAFEVVGIGGGGASERLVEVEALVAAGAISEGLHHASEVLDGIPASDEANAALAAAVARLNDGTDGVDLRIAAQVGGLIEYLKIALDTDAGVDGQYVAAMVREFGAPPIDAPGPTVDPGPPVEPPAPTVDPGPPFDPPAPTVDPAPPFDPPAPTVDPAPPFDRPAPTVDPGPPVDPPGPGGPTS